MKQVNSSDDISWRRQSTKSDALLTVKNFDNILCRDPINGLKEIDELLGIKSPSELKVGKAEILASETLISDSDKFALYEAIKNITFVSESQKQKISKSIKPIYGLSIWEKYVPIKSVGLYSGWNSTLNFIFLNASDSRNYSWL